MLQAMFLALAAPLVKRVLIALGIGIITYTASTTVLSLVSASLQNSFGAMPAVVLQMASLYGLPDFVGIILGAYSTSLTLSTVKKFGLL